MKDKTPPDKEWFFIKQYNKFYVKIFNYIYYRCGQNRDLADDLTSEIFLKAYEKIDSYDSKRAFSSWIYTVARNHLIDYYRSYKPESSLENLTKDPTSSTFIGDVRDKDQVIRLMKKLEQENPAYQEVLQLKYFGECSTEEIAEILDLSPNSVYVTIHRALSKLKQLKEEDE